MKKLTPTALTTMQPEQIAKYYFSEYPVSFRKQALSSTKHLTKDQLNDSLFGMIERIEHDKEAHLPLLLDSIATNSLGYELNERLQSTCYMDYHNKNISKHAKQFISGQFKIFRNENDKLLTEKFEETDAIQERLERVIELMVKLGVLGLINFSEHLEAIEKDPKSIEGIVKKVLRT